LQTIRTLQREAIEVFATLAPLLPCNPERLASEALAVTSQNVLGDPLHIRATKRTGATTRDEARRIAEVRGLERWFDVEYQAEIVARIQRVAAATGRIFAVGPEAFSWLAMPQKKT
jgi:hypothetical protein